MTIDGYKWAPRNNENGLKAQVSKQPVGAAVEAYERDFQLYGKVRDFEYLTFLC